MRHEIEADLTVKLRAQFNDEWNHKEATLKKEFEVEKTDMKKKISKVQKISKKYRTSYPARSQDPLINLLHWTPMKMLMLLMMMMMMRPNRSTFCIYYVFVKLM